MSENSSDEQKPQESEWHSLEADAVIEKLESSRDGLSSDEARERLDTYGPNRLRSDEKESPVRRFLRQFNNLLIYILLGAAVVTALLGQWLDTAVIVGVVIINALVGFLQEGRAERALESIRDMLSSKARVRREGSEQELDAEELVPGDVVAISSGDSVPADLRLMEADNLEIEQSVLTGESVPSAKATEPVDADTELAERASLAYSGTVVTSGSGVGIVIATGERSQIGRISGMLSEVETVTTPLVNEMNSFARRLSILIIVIALLGFGFGYWLRDYELVELFLAAVSLVVAAIPQGLPALMTIILALGVRTMAERNAIIRRLPAVETLGEMTVACADKTGTLTRNEMTAQTFVAADAEYAITGTGYAPEGEFRRDDQSVDPKDETTLLEALRVGRLCNDSQVFEEDGRWRIDGDPTEGALMTAALKAGLEKEEEEMPRLDDIPFSSERKYMATLHGGEDRAWIYLKGAPEQILSMCDRVRQNNVRQNNEDAELDSDDWQQRANDIADRGQRLLAVAVKEVKPGTKQLNEDMVEEGAVLLGLFGLLDPPRDEAVRAVKQCQSAGIRVKMITGDHAITAAAIGRKLGISGEAVSGKELDTMGDDELRDVATDVDVFARSSPKHKLRLVEALQAQEHVVAMTGDGVNDAPALKRADVGVAMALKGTEAAKEASEMVLADDNFASVAAAVEEGRRVYDNLTKAITFILPTNGGEALTILAAILLGLTLPLTPVQVLWVNMVTAVTLGLALGFEPAAQGIMQRPPRERGSSILSPFLLWRVSFVSVVLVAGTFGHFLWLQDTGVDIEFARTAALNTLVMGQVFYLFNSRFLLDSVLSVKGLFGSRAVLIAVSTLVVLQLAFTYTTPMQALFGTAAIGFAEWVRILLFGLSLFLLVELEKAWLRTRRVGKAKSGSRTEESSHRA